jgi:hypothetical protein
VDWRLRVEICAWAAGPDSDSTVDRYSTWRTRAAPKFSLAAAIRITPATLGAATAIFGANVPPWLWPSTNTRRGSTSFRFCRRATALTASGTYSAVGVKVLSSLAT